MTRPGGASGAVFPAGPGRARRLFAFCAAAGLLPPLFCVPPLLAQVAAVRSLPVPAVFTPGGQVPVAVSVTIAGADPITGAIVRETLPDGWGVSGIAPGDIQVSHDPATNTFSFVRFSGVGLASFVLSYQAGVPVEEVRETAVVAGSVLYTISGGLALAPVTGANTLSLLAPPPGDINGDGQADAADAVLALRMAAGLPVTVGGSGFESPYGALAARADLAGGQGIDICDALAVLRYALGRPPD